MSPIIEVIVSPQGQTRVETKGFSGSTCREASQFIERALGQVASERLTDNFYRPAQIESLTQRQS